MYGRDYSYARSRLLGSMVRNSDNDLVRVAEVSGGGNCVVENLSKGGLQESPLESLNLTPIPMGYINQVGGTSYTMRVPKRDDWRQGLRDNTMHSRGGGRPDLPSLALQVSVGYPSLGECLDSARGGLGKAFHRRWALMVEGKLHYCGMEVGRWSEEGQLTLNGKYSYLQEALNRAINSSNP